MKEFNILIIKHGALGDVIRTSYFLPGLKEKYKNSRIFWYTSEVAIPLLDENSLIDCLFHNKNSIDVLKNNKFDCVISLDDEREILRTLYENKIDVHYGAFFDGDRTTYTQNSNVWFDMGLLSKHGKKRADFLKKANTFEHNEIFSRILDIKIAKPFLEININKNKSMNNFNNNYFNIGFNPGSGGRWPSKKIKIKEAINLVNLLEKTKVNNKFIKIHMLGGKDEKELIRSIIKGSKNANIIDTGHNNSLKDFAKIISLLDLVVSSDSLALHLSIAQGIKNISFFAPTSAAEIGVFNNGIKIISTSDDYCSYASDVDNSTITADRIFLAISELFEDISKK